MAKLRTREAQGLPPREVLDRLLAKDKLRIVNLTDVTVTREALTKAFVKMAKIPGNEIPGAVETILKELVNESHKPHGCHCHTRS